MGRLNKWVEENFTEEPNKPDEAKLSGIMGLPYHRFKDMPIHEVERAIFILGSWIYYIGYQLGVLEGRANAMENELNADIAFEAQKLKDGYFNERCDLAKANNPKLRERSSALYETKAQAGTLKEMKFAIKDKVDALKMIYYRRRKADERSND